MLVFGGVEPCALAFGALISWKTSDRRDMYLAAFASSNGEPTGLVTSDFTIETANQ